MADREKLIAELANVIAHACPDLVESSCGDCDCVSCLATQIYNNVVTFAKDNNVPSKWISVKKRKPKVGEFVLFQYAKNNHNPTLHAKNTMAVGRYEQKMFLVEGCSVNVTHWRPLPEPPKGE